MADSHPNNLAPRPKRRRDEESPYEIYSAGINTDHPCFYLFFKGCDGVKHWMEIDRTLFGAFNEFELDNLSFFNEVDRLHRAIAKLPEKQRCRLVLYYLGEFTSEYASDTVMDTLQTGAKEARHYAVKQAATAIDTAKQKIRSGQGESAFESNSYEGASEYGHAYRENQVTNQPTRQNADIKTRECAAQTQPTGDAARHPTSS